MAYSIEEDDENSVETDEDGKYEIDPDTCLECGACAGTCPVGAPKE